MAFLTPSRDRSSRERLAIDAQGDGRLHPEPGPRLRLEESGGGGEAREARDVFSPKERCWNSWKNCCLLGLLSVFPTGALAPVTVRVRSFIRARQIGRFNLLSIGDSMAEREAART